MPRRSKEEIPEREVNLVRWFQQLFAARTPPQSILEAHQSYRVPWTEIKPKMNELGYTDMVVDLRWEWSRIYKVHRLKAYCEKLLRAAGEEVKWSGEA